MKVSNLIILESNKQYADELQNLFSAQADFKVCGVTGNGTTAITLIKQYKPEAIVMDLILSGTDGFGVLDYIRDSGISCAIIVASAFNDEKLIASCINHGVKYYLVKPISAQSVLERMRDLVNVPIGGYVVSDSVRDKRRVASVDEKISNIFISIGIPPHIKGYVYLREAIKMTIEKPQIINNITKELYPQIGIKFETSASKVERAIRHAIEVAWNKGRVDAINSMFGVRVYVGAEKPTNSEFIALIADKLILQELL